MAISQIPALPWELIFGRPGLGRTTPISKGNFTDSCSILRVHIWQKSVCRSTHPLKWQFHRFLLWLLIFLSYCKSSTFGRPGFGTSIPLSNGNFSNSCSYCSYFSPTLRAQHLADLPLSQMAISPIPALTAHIPFLLWEVIFGRPGLGRTTPMSKGNFTDSWSTLRVHIWQTKCWQIYPPSQMSISQTPALTAHISFLTLRAHIRQNRFWQIYPNSNGNFTDSCSDCSYFFPTLWAQHLADQVLADLSHPSNGSFTDSCSTLRVHIWQTKCWEIYPHLNGNFTDSCSYCSYLFPTLGAQHLAGQGLAYLPLF